MAVLIVCGVGQAVPVTDYAAALKMGYQYLDPRPQSEYVAGETRLLIRFERASPADLVNLSSFIQVVGEKSGLHTGKTTIATRRQDRRLRALGAVLMPMKRWTLALSPLESRSQAQPIAPIEYRFYVLRPAAAPLSPSSTTDLKVLAAESRDGARSPSGGRACPGAAHHHGQRGLGAQRLSSRAHHEEPPSRRRIHLHGVPRRDALCPDSGQLRRSGLVSTGLGRGGFQGPEERHDHRDPVQGIRPELQPGQGFPCRQWV